MRVSAVLLAEDCARINETLRYIHIIANVMNLSRVSPTLIPFIDAPNPFTYICQPTVSPQWRAYRLQRRAFCFNASSFLLNGRHDRVVSIPAANSAGSRYSDVFFMSVLRKSPAGN